jgi:hypothetical protein
MLVHEQNFGLDDESARNADALLHAPGKFFGISCFETIQTDGINNAERTLAAFDGRRAASLERGFDIFENGEPGEKGEALKNNGNVRRVVADRMAMPVNRARAGGRKTGQHAKQCGFAAARGAEQRNDLARVDGEIGGGNNLDVAAVGLRIGFLQLARFDDGSGRGVCGGHERVYYRSTAVRPHTNGWNRAAYFFSGYNGMNTA